MTTDRPKSAPCHETTLYLPNGRVFRWVAYPIKKLRVKEYCKYCYRTHRQWWQMRYEDYAADVMLCGYCEHTSPR